MKIYVSHPKYIANLRTSIERGLKLVNNHDHECLNDTTFESNVLYSLRFMIDCEIGGMTWVKIEKGNWFIRPREKKESVC